MALEFEKKNDMTKAYTNCIQHKMQKQQGKKQAWKCRNEHNENMETKEKSEHSGLRSNLLTELSSVWTV